VYLLKLHSLFHARLMRATQIEKLFDVACTLTDVMACVPLESASFDIGPRDYLMEFVSLLSRLRGGDSRFLPLLLTKINDSLPLLSSSPSMSPTGHLSLSAEDMDDHTMIAENDDLVSPITTSAGWSAFISAPSTLDSVTMSEVSGLYTTVSEPEYKTEFPR
jgi:hypothetical protein